MNYSDHRKRLRQQAIRNTREWVQAMVKAGTDDGLVPDASLMLEQIDTQREALIFMLEEFSDVHHEGNKLEAFKTGLSALGISDEDIPFYLSGEYQLTSS